MDRGAWWATVHRVAKSWPRLSDFTFTLFLQRAQRYFYIYPVRGIRTLPQGCTFVCWLLLLLLCIPSLPWLATVWTFRTQGRSGNKGHRKSLVPRSPMGSCSASTSGVERRLNLTFIKIIFDFKKKSYIGIVLSNISISLKFEYIV